MLHAIFRQIDKETEYTERSIACEENILRCIYLFVLGDLPDRF
jgi:hypothetical protein